jgi:preprotein translocase subunit SecA
MFGLFKKILSSPNERFVSKLKPLVAEINKLEEEISLLTDEVIRGETFKFKEALSTSTNQKALLDEILPRAFALVRESSKRVLGKRHYDVQLMGGIVLHRGMIAEMRTGEGKTLVATLPAYLNALTGKGVHIVTTNDYLVKRDSDWMGKLYNFLGLSVAITTPGQSDEEKRAAYLADITYGTNNEFGFDFLRDNLKMEPSDMIQRPFNYALVDEVDSVLIDEARTPLIISGKTNDKPELYSVINKLVTQLKQEDYELDEKSRTVLLTDQGIERAQEKLVSLQLLVEESSLYDINNIAILHHLDQSLKAHHLFKKDVDYMIKDGQVMIIDEHTGRVMEGRRYSDGLHQALEAKEKVKIQEENQTLASVTFQNYFRLYPKLSGMTGTAMKESIELAEIYNLQVIAIPTNLPVICKKEEDAIYRTAKEKYDAIVKEVKEAHDKKQPILIGTVSIEKSEYLSSILKKAGIKHQVLNAKYHELEAEIIAQAGKSSSVTIATNMAGRGTDIILGGNPEMLAMKVAKEKKASQEEYLIILDNFIKEAAEDQSLVKAAGGLLVIGTERHESRRIDDQLRGRAGRQGDPGRTKFFLSMEDDLMRLFGSEKISGLLVRLGLKEGESIVHPWVSKALERAQEKVEARNYEMRKNLLQFDDVINEQRRVIYSRRQEILEGQDNLIAWFKEITFSKINDYYELEDEDFRKEMMRIFSLDFMLDGTLSNKERNDLATGLALETFEMKATNLDSYLIPFLQKITLGSLDYLWKEHLYNLDQLRLGINLRSYGQKNPLLEYKNEAFQAFTSLLNQLEENALELFYKSLEEVKIEVTPKQEELQRNNACPCGSGKRYKHCHGKIS